MPKTKNRKEEISSIICCIDFLIDEAERSELCELSTILQNARDAVSERYVCDKSIDENLKDLVNAFKCVIHFILLNDDSSRDECIKTLSAIDKQDCKNYLMRTKANA